MDITSLIQDCGIYAGAWLTCLVSGVFPVVNAELSVIALVALAPGHSFFLIVLLATLGETMAKAGMYWTARGTLNLSLRRYQKHIEKWRSRFTKSEPGLSITIFTSAVVGLPPFFVTSIVAGAFRIPFVRYWIVGFFGRLVRFTIVGAFPKVIMEYL